MKRTPTHPFAENPLDLIDGKIPPCAFPSHSRSFITVAILEASLRHCASYVKGRLLDVGCGKKPYQHSYFSGAETYLGVDYLTDRSEPDIVASALDLPLEDSSFDTVVSTEVIEHLPDPLRALREMRRVVKPTGYVIVTAPMYWPRHDLPYDFYRYTYDGVLYLLKESGLELVRLFNRGRSYAYLGQVIQHVQPVPFKWFSAFINWFFLSCDRHLKHDMLTLGWTIIAKRSVVSSAGPTGAGDENTAERNSDAGSQ
jgi:SAM-dependent methyltransferase